VVLTDPSQRWGHGGIPQWHGGIRQSGNTPKSEPDIKIRSSAKDGAAFDPSFGQTRRENRTQVYRLLSSLQPLNHAPVKLVSNKADKFNLIHNVNKLITVLKALERHL